MADIRPMTADDLPTVERLIDEAATAWLQQTRETTPEFVGQRIVRSRFQKEPEGCFVAEEASGRVMGAVMSVSWGSVAWLGPLVVRPDGQRVGIDRQLVAAVLAYWESLPLSAQGVETLPAEAELIELYAAFDFRPQFLTATLVGEVDPPEPRPPIRQRMPPFELVRLSQLAEALEETMLGQCRRIADRHYPGLDYAKELGGVKAPESGDTLLLTVGERLYGFAICHAGEASEAGPKECYVKALLIDPAIDDRETLLALVEGCEGYARGRQLDAVRIGVNLACWEGYRALAERGYRLRRLRLRMVRPVGEMLSDPAPFHLNDWR
jgi:N-acetylglutamate synthase-like GNAT family acetyltransferase